MYTPLEIAKAMDFHKLPPEAPLRIISDILMEAPNNSLMFLSSESNFMNPGYIGPYREFSDYVLKNRKILLNAARTYAKADIEEGSSKEKEIISDCFISFVIVWLWSISKQIYRFDEKLEESLRDTEEISVPVKILDRLPYKTFSIEFAEGGRFKSLYFGVFIHFIQHKDGYIMFYSLYTENGGSRTGKIMFLSPENEEDEKTFIINKPPNICSEKEAFHYELLMFCLNAVLYLCAENSEVLESQTTKRTYKPSQTIRNKFSEVRIYECGYAFGETIRMQESEETKKATKRELKKETEDHAAPLIHSTKRPPRPHVRKAHWHHYWTGKGRTELVLRWIAPTMVGNGEKIVATIHKCK